MEEKLLELKGEFCKWYCLNRDDRNEYGEMPCENCMVEEYIKFSRDELNK